MNDLQNMTISELEEFYSKKILGHTRPTMKLQFHNLFRVRNVTNEKISNLIDTSCIWYPDWKNIPKIYHSLNRCSNKGQNFFYASNFLEATIKEINPNNNDLVLIGIFGMKYKNIKAQAQFAGIDSLKKNAHNKLLQSHVFPTHQDELFENEISEIYRKKISAENEHEYHKSIAFSNILLRNDEINCLVYPSVASNLEFENYGLKPEFVDANMYCERIYLYRVNRNKTEIILKAEKYGIISIDKNNPKFSSINWQENDPKEDKIFLTYSI